MENLLEKRLQELLSRSQQRNIYTYTDFLTPSEQQLAHNCNLFGGVDFAERKIACFGEDLGYEPSYPITLLRISLLGGKYAEKVTHRDVLGAIMNLGVERDKVGDIFVGEKQIYVCVISSISALLVDQLTTISHNKVAVEVTDNVPDEFAPQLQEKSFTVSSPRLDSIIGGLLNLSREKATEIITLGKVAINGTICEKASKEPKVNDVITVRGGGKFVYKGECGTSRKGKAYIKVDIYK